MADLMGTITDLWNKGKNTVESTASTIAKTASTKVDEFGQSKHKRELLSALGEKVYQLYQAGIQLPEECAGILQEVAALDEHLNALHSNTQQTVSQTNQPQMPVNPQQIPTIQSQPVPAPSVYDTTPISQRSAPSMSVPRFVMPTAEQAPVTPVSQHQAPSIDLDSAYSYDDGSDRK